jgi:Na+-translocating ferredoxin:NAD+ oxidoreductase RnfA subunit
MEDFLLLQNILNLKSTNFSIFKYGSFISLCQFLGASAKLQKATISFSVSVCLSLRLSAGSK